MGLLKNFVSQTRKPEGLLGKMMLKGMNSGHAKMADWGLGHLQSIDPEKILNSKKLRLAELFHYVMSCLIYSLQKA